MARFGYQIMPRRVYKRRRCRHSRFHGIRSRSLSAHHRIYNERKRTTTSIVAMVSIEDAKHAADKLGFVIPAGHDDDYIELLSKTDAACRAVLALEGEFMCQAR